VKARRAGKDVAQLGQQSIDPLIVEGDFTSGEGGKEIDKQALEDFMANTGLTCEQLAEGAPIPTSSYDKYQTYVYGQSLVNPDNYSQLGIQMFLLNKWYLEVTKNDEAACVIGRTRLEHYLGYDMLYVEFNELHKLLNREVLDKSLLSCCDSFYNN
jgi:hypothetical protein